MAFLWLLMVIVGMYLVRGETCSDALYCMHHIHDVRSDLEREDLYAVCSKTMMLVICVEASIKDCLVRNITIPQRNMAQLTKSIVQAKNIYKRYCNGVTPDPTGRDTLDPLQTVPTDATCSVISRCMLDTNTIADAVSNGRPQEACQLLRPSTQCLQSAISDCERRRQMTRDMLDSFKQFLADSRAKINRFCLKRDENNNDHNEDKIRYVSQTPQGLQGSAQAVTMDKTYLIRWMVLIVATLKNVV